MNATDQSVIRTIGEEAEGIVSPRAFRRGLGQSGDPEIRRRSTRRSTARSRRSTASRCIRARCGLTQALKKIGGKVEDREAFIDTVLKTELEGSPLGKAVKLDAYGNPIYDVYIRKVVKRADGKFWNVPIDDLSERLAVLEIRSGDLHEAAALFAHLPGHQEGLIHR